MATPLPENHASFTCGELLEACAGSSDAPHDLRVQSVSTDSRMIQPGALYIALPGDRFDGHAFLDQVAQKGAALAVVRRGADVPAGLPTIEVDYTLRALGDIAGFHRRRWGGRVIAVTGSAGKTTTKELLAAALVAISDGGEGTVTKTQGNLNNLVGVPLTLLTLDESHSTAVVEVGTSAPGEIRRLAEISAADAAVVTAVAVAHAEGLGSLAGVAEEKMDLLRALPPSGVAVYSADHPILRTLLSSVQARTLSFGEAEDADVRLREQHITCGAEGSLAALCRYSWPQSERSQEVSLAMLGSGPAVDAAAALSVVYGLLGASATLAAAAGLGRVRPVAGRLNPVAGPAGSIILDDTYNANPASVAASLRTLQAVARARQGRALAVLGDMRELGAFEADEHATVGVQCAQLRLAMLIGCGRAMAGAVEAARSAGLHHVQAVADAKAALPLLSGQLRAQDVVLVKGSRSMAMEQVVLGLVAEVGR